MLHMGMGLGSRNRKIALFAEGREDSLAMSIVGPDGSLYMAHSPLRRAVGKAIYLDLTPDITGGIARFKPVRLDLLARDAICAAKARAENAATLASDTYGAGNKCRYSAYPNADAAGARSGFFRHAGCRYEPIRG